MSLYQLSLDYKAVDVALSMSGTRLAVLSDTDVAVYALDMGKRPVPSPTLLCRIEALKGHCPRHVAFVGDEQIFVLTDRWDEENSRLWTSKGEKLVYQERVQGPGRTSSIVPSVDYQMLYLQFQDGSLHEVRKDEAPSNSSLQSRLVNKFPSFAPEVRVVIFDGMVWTRDSFFYNLKADSRSMCPSVSRKVVFFSPMNEYLFGTAHPS